MRLIAQNTVMVRSALKRSADAKAIADKWVAHNVTKSDDVNTVRDWVRINISFDNSPLERVLNQLWAASYVFGERDAINELTGNVGFDWDTWKPGNEAASLLVKPPKKLQAILNKSKATANEISRTTADRIGTKLSEGLEQGLGADEIARNINTVLDDPARSMVIARTETADALVQANLETYREAEVELVEWLVGDPCDICAENAGVQVRLGGVFPSGDEAPPAHPNCVCDVAPIVLTAEEMQNMDAFDLASKPDTLKYEENQPRDEHGRWGSTGAILDLQTIPENLVGANDTLTNLISPDFDGDRFEILYNVLDNQIQYASDFTTAWADSFENVEQFRDSATRALADGDPIDRVTLAGLELVNASPLTTEEAYRGASFTSEELAQFKEGETISLPFASFSTIRGEAENYTYDHLGGRNNPVVFKLESGAKAIPESSLSNQAILAEIVTSGNFQITNVSTETLKPDATGLGRSTNEATIISLKQTGTFDTEGLKVK